MGGTDGGGDRSIEERCEALASTYAQHRTISFQETMRAPEAPALDDPPASLPHISLVGDGADSTGGAARASPLWPVTHEPDLQIVGVLGEGGMGRVLAARQKSLRRDVALKTLRGDSASPAATIALLREGVITGALEHPSIVPIHAIGCDDRGRPVLVMKRIEGVAWSALLDDPRHPAWKKLDVASDDPLEVHLEILSRVCNALHFAHERGIVHRDVKPDNVMVGEFGEVYLVDWGIAARAGTKTDAIVGTPCFLAPEMVRGAPVDARTDVYLLGATLHQVLTGAPRHEGATFAAVLLAAAHSAPFSYGASVPEELADLCNLATHLDPDARPPSAQAMRRAIAEHLRHRGAIALCRAAESLLAEAKQSRRRPSADATKVLRQLTEARFGFRQSLNEWPEGAAAKRGLGECLEEMIELELAQGDDAGARALLEELPEPSPSLAARIADHEARARAEREHDERLRAMERDMDPAVARRARLASIVAGSILLVALSAYAMISHRGHFDARFTFLFAVVINLVLGLVALLVGKRVLRNAYNRQLFALVALGCLSLVAGRAVGWARGSPVDVTLTHDMISFTAISAVGTVTTARWLGWFCAFCAIGAVVSTIVEGIAPILFTLLSILVVVGALVGLRRKEPSVDERS